MKRLSQETQFTILFSILLLLCSLYFYWNNRDTLCLLFVTLAVFLCLANAIFTSLVTKLCALWLKFGSIIHITFSNIILMFMFFLVFSPIAILFRIRSRDRMNLKPAKTDTLWIKTENSNCQTMENQY